MQGVLSLVQHTVGGVAHGKVLGYALGAFFMALSVAGTAASIMIPATILAASTPEPLLKIQDKVPAFLKLSDRTRAKVQETMEREQQAWRDAVHRIRAVPAVGELLVASHMPLKVLALFRFLQMEKITADTLAVLKMSAGSAGSGGGGGGSEAEFLNL